MHIIWSHRCVCKWVIVVRSTWFEVRETASTLALTCGPGWAWGQLLSSLSLTSLPYQLALLL